MLETLSRLWNILGPRHRRRSLGILTLVILMAMAEAGGVLSIMPFLAVLGRPEVIQENPILRMAYSRLGFTNNRDFMIALGTTSIIVVVGSSIFKTITLHIINRFIYLLRHSISSRLLEKYLHQPYEFFLIRNISQLSRNVLSEVDQLLLNLVQPLSQLLAQGTVVLAMIALVLWYDALAAVVIVFVVGLLYAAIFGLVRTRLTRIGNERQVTNGQRFQSCNEALGGIKDVKVTQSTTAYQKQFDAASRTYSRHMAASETMTQTPLYLVEAVGYTGLIAIALTLMLHSNDVAQVLPALGLYGFATYRLLPAVQIMYRGIAKLRFSSAALDAIHQDLSLRDSEVSATKEVLTPQREIRLQAVSYAYPTAPDKSVLNHFDLVILANTSVGIAGRSGSGKSTVMDILLGLLQPQAGTLSIDGVTVDISNVAAWQRAIGYVPQHIFLADASVAENIAFGVPRDRIDMQAMERAARAAQIHDFVVNELPHSYETNVGDRGIRLSGGQRQRVGIARALYRDPPVLLLDEATSALDAQTEEALNEAIRRLSGSKTIVVIAHKEASLRGCQEVVNIDTQGVSSALSATEVQ